MADETSTTTLPARKRKDRRAFYRSQLILCGLLIGPRLVNAMLWKRWPCPDCGGPLMAEENPCPHCGRPRIWELPE